jgi:hypothetical protein
LPEQIQETKPQHTAQAGGSSGLKAAAAAAAAAGAAALIARKALSSGDGGSTNGHRSHEGGASATGRQGGAFGSIASGGLDAARDALGPAAEDAAAALGKFVAQNAPDVVRERIVPRFIESFNEARAQ